MNNNQWKSLKQQKLQRINILQPPEHKKSVEQFIANK